ncbi:hypothetical protein AVEN_64252-1 [Araneus ventricosus]|uniref:Tc1-like transposase DDE domain-containing protein n=1 Tax=Araneus ventricosus TaxID=182803 RepID=A0A4Y2MNT4_ARAVE|nr:hypothetical protein AVEN_64252-1 [Araneus ventricosus]
MGTDAIFMDDNSCTHRARLVRSYLESETIPQIVGPAISLDLNPITHVRAHEVLKDSKQGQPLPLGYRGDGLAFMVC